MDRLYAEHQDRYQFFLVYTREAHPSMLVNEHHATWDGRIELANRLCESHDLRLPILLDDVDDEVGLAYGGLPERAIIINRDGVVAFKSSRDGGTGPSFNLVDELEQALQSCTGL